MVFWANMHCAPCDAWAGQQKSPLKYLLAPWERERKKSLLCIEIALCVRIKKRNIFCSPLIFVFQWYLGIFFSVFSFISLQKSLIGNWKYPRVLGVGCSCMLTISAKTLSILSWMEHFKIRPLLKEPSFTSKHRMTLDLSNAKYLFAVWLISKSHSFTKGSSGLCVRPTKHYSYL